MNPINTVFTDRELENIEKSIFKEIITSSGFPKPEGAPKYYLPKFERALRKIVDSLVLSEKSFALKDASDETKKEYISFFINKYYKL